MELEMLLGKSSHGNKSEINPMMEEVFLEITI